MSLKFFHIFFITICLIFSGFLIYLSEVTSNHLIFFTGVFLLLALVPYSLWFLKKIKTLTLILISVATALSSKTLEACAVCYADNSAASLQTIQATKIGIVFVGAVIVSVLGMIAFTGMIWAKRAKQIQEI